MKLVKIILATVMTSFLVLGIAQAADYKIDKKGQHAFITFKANHLGYSYIIGRFNDFDGEFSHDASNPGASKVNVTIQAASIDSNHAARDKHLRSSDFLDVGKYPEINFTSTGYKSGSDGDVLSGKLELHGVSRDIDINVRHIGEGKDPWGGYRSGFEGTITLKASDYGMPGWVGDVDVELIVEGIKQ